MMDTTKKDYSQSVLTGPGKNDYEKYMKTEALLSLQRKPEEMLHRDELLFQTIHQSTELWLKLNCFELEEVVKRINNNELNWAIAALNRASQCIKSITEQLEILTYLTPRDFQRIRPALGNGSGLESPGWKDVHKYGALLASAINTYIKEKNLDLMRIYTDDEHSTTYNLLEALIDWDERVSLWRTRHYKIAIRIIGHNTIGTKGTPVDKLAEFLNHKYFPQLWQLRSQLSNSAGSY